MLLGLNGDPGAGKSTLASILKEEYGFHVIHFGDAIYNEVSARYGIPKERLKDSETKDAPLPELDGKSPRRALQDHATEQRQRYGDDYYLNKNKAEVVTLLREGEPVVVADVRKRVEAEFIQQSLGFMALLNPGNGHEASEAALDHAIEHELDAFEFDAQVVNVSGSPRVMVDDIAHLLVSLNKVESRIGQN